MNGDVGAADFKDVRDRLLIEGLRDWIQLAEIHSDFAFDDGKPKRTAAEAQQLTLTLIRDLVTEGLVILGVPDKKEPSRFKPWDLPLGDAMAYIEQQYVTNFDDRWNWVTCVWLALTEQGKTFALKLEHANDQ